MNEKLKKLLEDYDSWIGQEWIPAKEFRYVEGSQHFNEFRNEAGVYLIGNESSVIYAGESEAGLSWEIQKQLIIGSSEFIWKLLHQPDDWKNARIR